MRTLFFLLRKEFLQISRNKLIIRMIFAIPVVQLIVLPNAANYEMKNINMCAVDQDHSEYSRQFSASHMHIFQTHDHVRALRGRGHRE